MTGDDHEFNINHYFTDLARAVFQTQAGLALKIHEAASRAAFDLGARDMAFPSSPVSERALKARDASRLATTQASDTECLKDEKQAAAVRASKAVREIGRKDSEREQEEREADAVADSLIEAERQGVLELVEQKGVDAAVEAVRSRRVVLFNLRKFKPPAKSETADAVRDAARKLALGRALAGPRDAAAADEVIGKLYSDFPWFQAVLADLLAQLRVSAEAGDGAAFRPMLLVGPPGVGKTRFASKLASALGVHFERHDCGGQDDVRALAGTARGWASAEFAAPVRALLACDHANPLFFLDEIEKAGARWAHYKPSTLVLPWLESSSSATWRDPLLLAPVDVSHVLWTFGANELVGLPAPFLSRVSVYEIPTPGPSHFDALFDSIVADIEERERRRAGPVWPIKDDNDEPERDLIEPEVRGYLRERFAREKMSPRQLAKLVKKAADATPRRSGVRAQH